MLSEFEEYRWDRLKSNAFEYCELVGEEGGLYCPTCGSEGFKIGEFGVKCLFCGEQVELDTSAEE